MHVNKHRYHATHELCASDGLKTADAIVVLFALVGTS